jgi:hypothetical protein
VRIPLVRSRLRAGFAALVALPFTMGCLVAPFAAASEAADENGDPLAIVMFAVLAALTPVSAPIQLLTLRALLGRTWMTLDTDALVIHDPVLLRAPFRIGREHVAGAEPLNWKDPAIWVCADYDVVELSPFQGERLNIVVRLRGEDGFPPARSRLSGTWIWLIHRTGRAPRMPERGSRYRLVRLRAKAPADAVAAITAWAGAAPVS